MCHLTRKRNLAGAVMDKDSEMGDYAGLSTWVLKSGRGGQRCSIRCCCWLWRCKKIVMSQRMWRLLEGGNDPQVRANKRMETLVQNCKELNSAKDTNKHKMNPPLHAPERARACQHLVFFPYETPTALLTYRMIINLCCLKSQSCGNLLQQRQETDNNPQIMLFLSLHISPTYKTCLFIMKHRFSLK